MASIAYEAALDPHAQAARTRYAAYRIAVYAFLTIFALIYLLPLLVIVANSFRELPEITQNGLIAIPRSLSLARGRRPGCTIASPAPARASITISTIRC